MARKDAEQTRWINRIKNEKERQKGKQGDVGVEGDVGRQIEG